MTDAVLDPRLHAYRDDLAAASLRGRVEAARFVEGTLRQVVEASAPMRRAPRFDAGLDTEALFGDTIQVYEEREGWAWGQLTHDSYVGYVPVNALGEPAAAPSHRVSALRTFVFPAPDIKAPPLMLVSLNAGLTVVEERDTFLRLSNGGFVPRVHASPLGAQVPDFVAVAERLLGTPYLWGGRTSLGIDCSGLVQLALNAAGLSCPRDTDMQKCALGSVLPGGAGTSELRRGDIVFWPGHVGIMADGARLVHANAHCMETAVEPLAQVAARNPAPITCVRRI